MIDFVRLPVEKRHGPDLGVPDDVCVNSDVTDGPVISFEGKTVERDRVSRRSTAQSPRTACARLISDDSMGAFEVVNTPMAPGRTGRQLC